jgi:hypothetical protein
LFLIFAHTHKGTRNKTHALAVPDAGLDIRKCDEYVKNCVLFNAAFRYEESSVQVFEDLVSCELDVKVRVFEGSTLGNSVVNILVKVLRRRL